VLLEVRRKGRTQYLGVQFTETPPAAKASRPPPTGGPSATGETREKRDVVVVQVVPTQPGAPPPPVVVIPGGGGGSDTDLGMRPPAFSAPGDTRLPGVTMPPPPGAPMWAYPQIAGVSQPREFFHAPLSREPLQPFVAGGPPPTAGGGPKGPTPAVPHGMAPTHAAPARGAVHGR
jgi:hypothetical protein